MFRIELATDLSLVALAHAACSHAELKLQHVQPSLLPLYLRHWNRVAEQQGAWPGIARQFAGVVSRRFLHGVRVSELAGSEDSHTSAYLGVCVQRRPRSVGCRNIVLDA